MSTSQNITKFSLLSSDETSEDEDLLSFNFRLSQSGATPGSKTTTVTPYDASPTSAPSASTTADAEYGNNATVLPPITLKYDSKEMGKQSPSLDNNEDQGFVVTADDRVIDLGRTANHMSRSTCALPNATDNNDDASSEIEMVATKSKSLEAGKTDCCQKEVSKRQSRSTTREILEEEKQPGGVAPPSQLSKFQPGQAVFYNAIAGSKNHSTATVRNLLGGSLVEVKHNNGQIEKVSVDLIQSMEEVSCSRRKRAATHRFCPDREAKKRSKKVESETVLLDDSLPVARTNTLKQTYAAGADLKNDILDGEIADVRMSRPQGRQKKPRGKKQATSANKQTTSSRARLKNDMPDDTNVSYYDNNDQLDEGNVVQSLGQSRISSRSACKTPRQLRGRSKTKAVKKSLEMFPCIICPALFVDRAKREKHQVQCADLAQNCIPLQNLDRQDTVTLRCLRHRCKACPAYFYRKEDLQHHLIEEGVEN